MGGQWLCRIRAAQGQVRVPDTDPDARSGVVVNVGAGAA